MSDVVLFHHVQGLTPGVQHFADRLREHGHVVVTPDLFEGRTFDSIEAGIAYVSDVGFAEILERGGRAGEAAPAHSVYAGFSLGVIPAQFLTQTRPGAKGGLFFHSCLPVSEFRAWPEGVPVQIHAMEGDPYFVDEGDIESARELAASVVGAELFLYPGDAHLFADDSLEDYDESSASLLFERVLAFLSR